VTLLFMTVKFFSSQARFREWLLANHQQKTELFVGFHKKASEKKSITYPEALDEALCFGWIDGVRKSIDESSYKIRFTPRKSKSIWSLVNTRRVEELIKLDRMHPAGIAAFKLRSPDKTGVYSFENSARELDPSYTKRFRANKQAWDFFQLQPPGYRRIATFWIMSAKQEETRLRRLEQLINDSSKGVRLGTLTPGKKRSRD
jgi:uncharacterized protein YdeI (YjbR/CyaY-like superfamily)